MRALVRAARALDAAIGQAGRRTVLVEARTPMNVAVLRPMYGALARDPRLRLLVTSENLASVVPLLRRENRGGAITRARAAWTRVDLYLNADPWGAVRLHRCARRMNFFHGVAGKYDLDCPTNLPLGFETYDRVAFVNVDRMQRYVKAGIVTADQARLVGFPKVDALVNGQYDARTVRGDLGLDPARPTALYGPTFSRASSLHASGPRIVAALLDADVNVIIKLHDRSFDPAATYSGGVDWRARFEGFAGHPQFAFATGPDSTPYLAAADLVVTDHSSLGFEYLLLDRPLVVYDAPELAGRARINPDKIALLRSAAQVVRCPAELTRAVREALANPSAQSADRRRVANQMFHLPGTATERALGEAYDLLSLEPWSVPSRAPVLAGAAPDSGGAR